MIFKYWTICFVIVGSLVVKSEAIAQVEGFPTELDEQVADILVLENGAVVELERSRVRISRYDYIVLLLDSGSCDIWIEGIGLEECSTLRGPESRYAYSVESIVIEEIFDDGEVLFAEDGRRWETYESHVTGLWILPLEVLLIEGEMLELTAGEKVAVFEF